MYGHALVYNFRFSVSLWLFVSFLETSHMFWNNESERWLHNSTRCDPGFTFPPHSPCQNRVRVERPVSCEREPRGVYGVEGNSGRGACVTCPLLSVQLLGECKLSVPQGGKNAGYAQQLCTEEPLECQACVWSAVTHCGAVTWANKGSTLLKKRGREPARDDRGKHVCAHSPYRKWQNGLSVTGLSVERCISLHHLHLLPWHQINV